MDVLVWTLGIFSFILACATVYLIYAFFDKTATISRMNEAHEQLMRSFEDLDEQARLIVRTDLELNRAREEMVKRVDGLNSLQRTSRQMSQALNEDEIFQKIPPALFEDLGFSRALVAIMNDKNVLKPRLKVSFTDSQIESILKGFEADPAFKAMIYSLSTNNTPTKTREKIALLFGAEYYILSPVPTQNGNIGFVFVGNGLNAPAVTQADEELITIFAGQMGQSIENALLFEKVFRSSQELEIKVTERTKELASALQKVNDVSKKKTEFISAVSHELRTPLTSIKGYAAILIAGKVGAVPDGVKERLIKINSHSDHLVGLINNLLDIARIESGKQEMKYAVYKVKSIVDNVADLLTPQMTTKGVKLELRLPPEVEEVYVDISHAERVLINLVNNAIKFTPAQGTITIAVAPTLEQGFAVFSVTDTGIGIPAADIQKLFSEFYRVDNEINQNVKGTGLGLVLAKNIVQAHRGKIWVESKVGVGTTFSFTLPPSQEAFDNHLEPEKANA